MPTFVSAYGAQAAASCSLPMQIERRDVGPKDVLIDIKFCGICHSDIHFTRGEWGEVPYPAVPGPRDRRPRRRRRCRGHRHKVGDRVGVGCMVNSCRECENCRKGDEQYCLPGNTQTYGSVDRDGTVTNGGYSTHVVVDEDFVAARSRTGSISTSPRRCCARGSRPTRRCATGGRAPASRSRSSASAAWDTWP